MVQAMLGRIDALEVVPGEEEELQRRVARLNTRMGAVQAAVETHATIGARALPPDAFCCSADLGISPLLHAACCMHCALSVCTADLCAQQYILASIGYHFCCLFCAAQGCCPH